MSISMSRLYGLKLQTVDGRSVVEDKPFVIVDVVAETWRVDDIKPQADAVLLDVCKRAMHKSERV